MCDYDFDSEMASDQAEFEIKELEQKIERLETERDQLAASNARLVYQLEGYLESIDLINQEMIDSNGCPTAVSTKDGWDVVYSNPQQSLAEIQAKAVEDMANTAIRHREFESMDYQGIMGWAEMLREQEKTK